MSMLIGLIHQQCMPETIEQDIKKVFKFDSLVHVLHGKYFAVPIGIRK